MKKDKLGAGHLLHHLAILLLALAVLAPFYVQIVYAFKSRADVAVTSLAPPTQLYLGNFGSVFANSSLIAAFGRTLIVTIVCVVALQFISSMCAWVLVRNERRRYYKALYYLFLAAIMLPFQVVMLPLYSLFRSLGLLNTIVGLIVGICGFQLAYNIFIIASFIKTVPLSMEEAARIDGASVLTTYWKIVLPLLKPIMITSLILNSLSAWNDFQVTVVLAFKENVRTLQYALFMFFGQYSAQIHEAFAAFLIAIIPIVVLYLSLQRFLISGLTTGSVKE